ncbi:MAG: DNA-binding protein [Proteobacteria bacterium]|nr:DNA-binding protein [Pseudomonadota bacterium]MBU1716870.1 DNA-binding protein [Pseudomonadota bacterium]
MDFKIRKFLYLIAGVTVVMVLTSCSNDTPKTKTSTETATPQVALDKITLPLAMTIKGKVLEVLSGGGFTFILLEHEGEKKWASAPSTKVEVNEEVTLLNATVFPDFYSKSLDRKFDNLIFASSIEGKNPQSGTDQDAQPSRTRRSSANTSAPSFQNALQEEMPATLTGETIEAGSAKAVVPFAELKIERAPGSNGFTVAELFAKAPELDGKEIVINGKVMKFSPNIMGKNWLHIQDGTGDPQQQTHDLVITSTESAENDTIVKIKGILRANKDFGAGYKYAVIVEEAHLNN